MARRSGWLAAIAVAGILSSACDREHAQPGKQEETKLLAVIEAALQGTRLQRETQESPDGPLLDVPSIREVFRTPAPQEAEARAVIADPRASGDAKRVAALLMQCLPIDEYIDFVRFIFENVHENRCPDSVLSNAIFPGEDWGFVLAESHQRADVRELLLEIDASNVGGDAMRAKIKAILEGQTAAYLKHVRETGASVPAIGCAASAQPAR